MKRMLLVALAAVTVAVAGCSGRPPGTGSSGTGSSGAAGGSQPAGDPARTTLSWHGCPSVAQGLLCASLQVPLDYGKPSGRKITLALSEVPATAPASSRQGVLLVNPGGPGGPGRSLAAFVADGLDPSVAAQYTIVGFDTRGVGASVPAVMTSPPPGPPSRS